MYCRAVCLLPIFALSLEVGIESLFYRVAEWVCACAAEWIQGHVIMTVI